MFCTAKSRQNLYGNTKKVSKFKSIYNGDVKSQERCWKLQVLELKKSFGRNKTDCAFLFQITT